MESPDASIVWIKRDHSPPSFELRVEGRPIGTLTWLTGSPDTAVADTPGKILVFRKKGILRQRVVVETIAEKEIARASLSMFGTSGVLRIRTGEQFRFEARTHLDWLDGNGNHLARITHKLQSVLEGGYVENQGYDGTIPLILLFLGWYIHCCLFRRRAGHDRERDSSTAFWTGSADRRDASPARD